jgi:hypothetical protein
MPTQRGWLEFLLLQLHCCGALSTVAAKSLSLKETYRDLARLSSPSTTNSPGAKVSILLSF